MARNGGDSRGSAERRRERKWELLAKYGDGSRCNCIHCGCELTFETCQQDRIIPGGPYTLANLQPSCGTCNKRRSNRLDWVSPLALAGLDNVRSFADLAA